jgi:hypothetical protein
LLAYVTLKWRYEFPLSLLPTVDPGTVQYALDVCDVCVILRHSRGPHHQLESTDLTSPWTKKSRMRVLPWPFRSTFASCDLVLIRTHPFAFPCVGRLITVLATRGLRWMDTQSALMARVVASMFVTCIRASHPGAATTFRTRRTRLRVAWAWPWQTLPCARWSVSVEGHGLFHEWCYPAVLGARRLCRTAQPTGAYGSILAGVLI